jgi:hypothetical protein
MFIFLPGKNKKKKLKEKEKSKSEGGHSKLVRGDVRPFLFIGIH